MTVELLTSREVAEKARVAERTLDQWAYRGSGPPFLKIGRHRRYPADALEAWIAAQPKGGEQPKRGEQPERLVRPAARRPRRAGGALA